MKTLKRTLKRTLKIRRYATELDYLRALEGAVFQVVPRECGEDCCPSPPLDESLADLHEAFESVWGPGYDELPLEPPVRSTRPDLAAYAVDLVRIADDIRSAATVAAINDSLKAIDTQLVPEDGDEYRRGQRRGVIDCANVVRRLLLIRR
jgi:hypothetical protein